MARWVQFLVLTTDGWSAPPRVDIFLVPEDDPLLASGFVNRFLSCEGDLTAGRPAEDVFVMDALEPYYHDSPIRSDGSVTGATGKGDIVAQHWRWRVSS
jgi:hypothetical protein